MVFKRLETFFILKALYLTYCLAQTDNETMFTDETFSDTTYSPYTTMAQLTIATKCFINVTNVISTDSQITLILNTNFSNNFTCYSNHSLLIIKNDIDGSVNEAVCQDLEPATEYSLEFETDCDTYVGQEPVLTKYESLNCLVKNKQDNDLSVECDGLKCRNCSVVFELIDKEVNTSEYIKVSSGDKIAINYTFSVLNCSEYELHAFVEKQYLSPSDKIQIDPNIEIFPNLVNFEVKMDIENKSIEFLINNLWKYCRYSQIRKIISAPVECNSSHYNQIFESLMNVSSSNYLNETINNEFIKLMTNYSFEVIVEKQFETSVKLVNRTIFIETDGLPVILESIDSNANKIWFQLSDIVECTYFKIYCKYGNNVTIDTIYDQEFNNGSCSDLESNQLYDVVVETKNHTETITYVQSIFTKLVPVWIISFDQNDELNFTYKLNCTQNQFDSYQLAFRDLSSIDQLFVNRSLISQGCSQLEYDINFDYKTELLYGSSYEVKIRTFGCNQTCSAVSESFYFKTRLDNFQLLSSPVSTLSSTNNSISLKLATNDLPRDQYGTILISCANQLSNKATCIPHTDNIYYLLCTCYNLNSNSEYQIFLLNEKKDFVPVQNYIKNFYTIPNPVILKPITFTGLIGFISFEPNNPDPLTHQICYIYRTREFCSPLIGNKFNGTDKEDFKFGSVYTFYIISIGYNNFTVKSNENEVKVGLDKVKIPSNYPVFSSERIIRVTFEQERLPEQNWDSITIKCQSFQTELISKCSPIGKNMTCTCDTLIESTAYNVLLLTNKDDFNSEEVLIGLAYTKPPLVSCKIDTSENLFELSVECLLDKIKVEYVSELVLYLVNEENKQVVNVTCSTGAFQNCNLQSLRFFTIFKYNFEKLTPGTNYSFESRSYSSRIPTSQFNMAKIKFQTDMDGPRLVNIAPKLNNLEVRFQPPQTENYELEFILYEYKNNDFKICTQILYKKNAKFSTDSITFDYQLSTAFKVEYKVGFKMSKIGFTNKEQIFGQSYRVPFPGYGIALSTIGGILLFVLPVLVFFLLRYHREKKIKERTLVKPNDLQKIIDDWNEHQNAGLEIEWLRLNNEAIETEMKENYELYGNDSENRNKNRYKDILPYKHSRVELLTFQNDEDNNQDNYSSNQSSSSYYFNDDYINANFIPGLESEFQYIACQAPLKNTFNDFWKMIYERYISLVIMLANVYEKGYGQNLKNCEVYWPQKLNEKRRYGALTICVTKIVEHEDYDIRYILIEADETHKVRHYNFKSWPDKKYPKKEALYNFLKVIRTQRLKSDNKGSVLVHCSAGIGRTGTYLAIEYLAELIRNKKNVDIYQRVLQMRRYRPKMVQNSIQYRFIYEMLAYINERQNKKRSFKRPNEGFTDINHFELATK